MTIRIFKLTAFGINKEKATILFNGESHLIFGPTDTGKSYIVECFRYCLGGRDKPKDIGFSEGYTTLSLHVKVNEKQEFTIFRDLVSNEHNVYHGFTDVVPNSQYNKLNEDFSSLLTKWSNVDGKLILTKRGVKGNFTAGDIRFISIFDEIRTLDNDAFIGSDSNLKTRNASGMALVLSGNDDSNMVLPLSTDDINKAKGHAAAIEEQIDTLKKELPDNLAISELEDSLEKVDSEIKRVNGVVKDLGDELLQIRTKEISLENEKNEIDNKIIAFNESLSRFYLLNEKYLNDISRLELLKKAAEIVPSFEIKSCPLCSNPLKIKSSTANDGLDFSVLSLASESEIEKITSLQSGLLDSVKEIKIEIDYLSNEKKHTMELINDVVERKKLLLKPVEPIDKFGLDLLSERKSELTLFIKTLEKIDSLGVRLSEVTKKTKRTKHKIIRDLSVSSTSLCQDIFFLLSKWQVPGVNTITFDDKFSDILINHRQRVSFGKGKRGIFLTAFMVCLMERAIKNGNPHPGFLIIDSPVVTYKDPKHSMNNEDEDEDLLDESVKDHFYSWLGNETTLGQIIVLENEEPSPLQKGKLNYTEFVGMSGSNGRKGFFPA
ncbi:TPA: AAA family ATPase [Citrobacter freundii]|nr:AAA family ATPase [Citrobacter freundii]